ncbi:hypothetical protein [Actinomadura sp. KC216]|uniref:hypothetical protein n=1 Tax=Actinomadura sp. KC216 TaxID=2530370 RepID=UPI001FB781FC|nr:hypothetical protein [Actinomadura sp. KC216]
MAATDAPARARAFAARVPAGIRTVTRFALATSERGVTRRETVDLARVAEEVLASRRDQATAKGVDLAERLAPAVTAGDPGLLEASSRTSSTTPSATTTPAGTSRSPRGLRRRRRS